MKHFDQTLFIDCTATYYLGLNTGIQRVVRNIVKRARTIAQENDIDVIPVVSKFGQFWQSEEFEKLNVSSAPVKSMVKSGSAIAIRLESHEKSVLKRTETLPPLIVYAYVVSAMRRLLRYAGYALLQAPFVGAWATGRVKRAKPKPGDVLLMPDAFWAFDVISPLEKPRYRVLDVIPVIHDLIPLTHPKFCDANFIRVFERILPKICARSSGLICISNATRHALDSYLSSENLTREHQLPKAIWYSGSDLASEPDAGIEKMELRESIQALSNAGSSFLMVGTIEPRKGYDFLFETFTKLWESGRQEHLIIVGRVGWMCEDLIQQMERSRYHGRLLHVYIDANDRELNYLYKSANALIFASRAEGFGLPLVEAMQHALPVLASDIEVFREIGGDSIDYFRVDDPESLIRAVIQFEETKHEPKKPAPWHSWEEATERLLTTTIDVASEGRAHDSGLGADHRLDASASCVKRPETPN